MRRRPQWTALFFIVCLFATAGPTSAYALDFARHSIDSENLNAILVTGEVRVGDTDRLLNYVRSLPPKNNNAVYLSSPGGNLYEGMRLGRMFKAERIKTVVEGSEMCASACAVPFLGGRDRQGARWMSSTTTSRLGFHAFRNGDGSKTSATDDTQRIVSDMLQYGRDVDAPMQILIKTFATPSGSMYWLSEDELLQLGVKVWSIEQNCFVLCR
jgi:hypothetical protein